jgi:hypothetical protein
MITLNTRIIPHDKVDQICLELEKKGIIVATIDEQPDSYCIHEPWKYSAHDFDNGTESCLLDIALRNAGIPKSQKPFAVGYDL